MESWRRVARGTDFILFTLHEIPVSSGPLAAFVLIATRTRSLLWWWISHEEGWGGCQPWWWSTGFPHEEMRQEELNMLLYRRLLFISSRWLPNSLLLFFSSECFIPWIAYQYKCVSRPWINNKIIKCKKKEKKKKQKRNIAWRIWGINLLVWEMSPCLYFSIFLHLWRNIK